MLPSFPSFPVAMSPRLSATMGRPWVVFFWVFSSFYCFDAAFHNDDKIININHDIHIIFEIFDCVRIYFEQWQSVQGQAQSHVSRLFNRFIRFFFRNRFGKLVTHKPFGIGRS